MKSVIVSLLTFVILAFGVRYTFGQCDCAKDIDPKLGFATAYDELKSVDVVFYGQIVEVKMLDQKPEDVAAGNYEVGVKFRVEKAWRKDLDEFVTIREYRNHCLIGFDVTERWLVYGRFDKNNYLRTNSCTRTKRADKNVDKDFKEFEKNGEKQTKIIKPSRK